jgi:hypothetical protein
MAITTIQQSTEVSGVGMLTLSDTVHDDVNSVWVRELKAFGDEVGGVRPLLFTLRMTASSADPLAFTAPVQTF